MMGTPLRGGFFLCFLCFGLRLLGKRWFGFNALAISLGVNCSLMIVGTSESLTLGTTEFCGLLGFGGQAAAMVIVGNSLLALGGGL